MLDLCVTIILKAELYELGFEKDEMVWLNIDATLSDNNEYALAPIIDGMNERLKNISK